MQRFYDVQVGRILIDGQDISRVTQESLRDAIGVVPQDISLFHRSVMENIRYGRPDASDDEVSKRRSPHAAISSRRLPEGVHTLVGERGVKLSGGQRQRIAVARAFLKDAPLLLLDEATSALDGESEEAIREALGPSDARANGGRDSASAVDGQEFRPRRRAAARQGSSGRPPDHLVLREGLYRQLVQREVDRLNRQAAA